MTRASMGVLTAGLVSWGLVAVADESAQTRFAEANALARAGDYPKAIATWADLATTGTESAWHSTGTGRRPRRPGVPGARLSGLSFAHESSIPVMRRCRGTSNASGRPWPSTPRRLRQIPDLYSRGGGDAAPRSHRRRPGRTEPQCASCRGLRPRPPPAAEPLVGGGSARPSDCSGPRGRGDGWRPGGRRAQGRSARGLGFSLRPKPLVPFGRERSFPCSPLRPSGFASRIRRVRGGGLTWTTFGVSTARPRPCGPDLAPTA